MYNLQIAVIGRNKLALSNMKDTLIDLYTREGRSIHDIRENTMECEGVLYQFVENYERCYGRRFDQAWCQDPDYSEWGEYLTQMSCVPEPFKIINFDDVHRCLYSLKYR